MQGRSDRAPDVSVCVPYYRGAELIERCIASVAMQILPHPVEVEIVVAADSHDGEDTAALERVESRYGATVHRNPERLGMTGNWDRALRLGTGRIVTLLHQDDWYHPECLAGVLEQFEDEAVVLVAPTAVSFQEDGRQAVARDRERSGRLPADDFKRLLLGFEGAPAPSQAFFRAAALEGLEPFYSSSYSYSPEFDLYLRLADAHPGAGFELLDRRLVNRTTAETQHGRSIWHHRLLDSCAIFTDRIGGDALAVEEAIDDGVHARILSSLTRAFAALDTLEVESFTRARAGLESIAGSEAFWRFVDCHEAIAAELVRRLEEVAKQTPHVPAGEVLLAWRERGLGSLPLIEAALRAHRVALLADPSQPGPIDPGYPGRPPLRRPVLIAGFHHSGTRLLAQILDGIGVFQPVAEGSPTHETRFLQILDSLLLPDWNRPDAVHAYEHGPGGFGVDPTTILYRLWAAGYDGSMPWGFKDPRLGPVLDAWLDAFPEATVVHIVRDPLDVIATLGPAYAPFSPSGLLPQQDVGFWCDLWEAVTARTLAAGERAATFVELRFEDLVARPDATVEDLLAGLGGGLRHDRAATVGIRADRVGAHRQWLEEGRIDVAAIDEISRRLDRWRDRYRYGATEPAIGETAPASTTSS